MFPRIDRVYVNNRARVELGWTPKYDFEHVLELVAAGASTQSALAQAVGSKGYHEQIFSDGPYPVDTERPERT